MKKINNTYSILLVIISSLALIYLIEHPTANSAFVTNAARPEAFYKASIIFFSVYVLYLPSLLITIIANIVNIKINSRIPLALSIFMYSFCILFGWFYLVNRILSIIGLIITVLALFMYKKNTQIDSYDNKEIFKSH